MFSPMVDPELVAPNGPPEEALARAVTAALRAPSVFNTQPWHWRLHDGVAELWADRDRQLATVDPDGRLLVLSCGVALHHARIAVAAAGRHPVVTRFPDPGHAGPLAELRIGGPYEPADEERRAYAAIAARHTDRRPYAAETDIPRETLALLRDAAESAGAHLHVLRDDQVPELTVAAAGASMTETADPAYSEELNVWTHRPSPAGDGVPVETAVRPVPRRVPVRDFAPGADGLAPGGGTDRHARYAVVFTDADDVRAWLAAGEATSAVLLAATVHGLATNPVSDVVETPVARDRLAALLARIGHPQLVVRLGRGTPAQPVPRTPRRAGP
ncbi:NAD(P)H nitroreductase [Actinocatenispora rupis]|uniref:NAD(P)H nitroreductase n=2 Tax=Actinocatenispora rupis TaxID=519421 RepID=A0A8J3NH43_9ACTN|nr:NAD(P)H nitroreductase [Actinocatenispora rupis]